MGLVSGRVIIILLLLFVGFGWSLGNGYVSWSKPTYECFGGKGLTPVGDKVAWLWVGHFQIKYQPYKWGCDSDHAYDSNQYKVVDGLLVPITR